MLVTGDFIDAREARARGLINRVVPLEQLDQEVAALVDTICAKSPLAVAMGKQMFYKQLEMGKRRRIPDGRRGHGLQHDDRGCGRRHRLLRRKTQTGMERAVKNKGPCVAAAGP